MSIIVILDWTAERLRAWAMASGEAPRPVNLEPTSAELPLVISLAERRMQVGKPGRMLVRKAPHQVAATFLPYLGTDRHWQHGRHDVDAREAVQFVLGKLKEKLPGKALLHLAPNYFTADQAALLDDLTRTGGYRLLGTLPRGLASAGLSPGITIDADTYAVTLAATTLTEPGPRIRLQRTLTLRELGLQYWKERIGSQLASLCIRDCRRDPRATPETDQLLSDQIDQQLHDWSSGIEGRLSIPGPDWQHEAVISAALVQAVCQPMASLVAQQVLALPDAGNWFLTPESARLPGLAAALYAQSQNQRSVTIPPVEQLPRTAAAWAVSIERGQLPVPGFQAASLPLLSESLQEPQPDTLPFMGKHSRSENRR